MVQVKKTEWHQVSREFSLEFDTELLSEIYPDKDEDELNEMLHQLENGEVDPEDVVLDALDNDVELEWDHVDDDWWTDRKGGYEITYELGE